MDKLKLLLIIIPVYSLIYPPEITTRIQTNLNHSSLRPASSSQSQQDISAELLHTRPKFNIPRISESTEEAHYWYLYHKLYLLNRSIDSWFKELVLSPEIRDTRVRLIMEIIDEVLGQLPGELPQLSFQKLSEENQTLNEDIANRHKEIEGLYEKSLKLLNKPEDRPELERINSQLDALNRKQTEDLIRRSKLQLIMAKNFLVEGIKRRDSTTASKPNIAAAMGSIIGARDNMERITTEIYWRRVREYTRDYTKRLVEPVEIEGLFTEEARSEFLGDWDIFIIERGRVKVKQAYFVTETTPEGEKIRRREIIELEYPDIVTACSAQLNIILSQDQEVLRIFSKLAQMRYIVRRIRLYSGSRLPENLKKEAASSLEDIYKWASAGQVGQKISGADDLKLALERIHRGDVDSTIKFIEYARSRLLERTDAITSNIRSNVYKRFLRLNWERRDLEAKDEDIKQYLASVTEVLRIQNGITGEGINALCQDYIDEAKALLNTLLGIYFRDEAAATAVRRDRRHRIQETIRMVEEVSLAVKERDSCASEIEGLTLNIESIHHGIEGLQKEIEELQALPDLLASVYTAIDSVKSSLSALTASMPRIKPLQEKISLLIAGFDTAKRMLDRDVNPQGHLSGIMAQLNSILSADEIDTVAKEEISGIILQINSILGDIKANIDRLDRFLVKKRIFNPENARRQIYQSKKQREEMIASLKAGINRTQSSIEDKKKAINAINDNIRRMLSLILANISAKPASGVELEKTEEAALSALEDAWKRLRTNREKILFIRSLSERDLGRFSLLADRLSDRASERAFIHHSLWYAYSILPTPQPPMADKEWNAMIDSVLLPEKGGSPDRFMSMFKENTPDSIRHFFNEEAQVEVILKYSDGIGKLDETIRVFERILKIGLSRETPLRRMAEIIASDARRKNKWLPLASLLNWVGKGIYSDTTPAPERIEPAKKATTLLLINAAA